MIDYLHGIGDEDWSISHNIDANEAIQERVYLMQAETKLPPFSKRHFQIPFLEMNFDWTFTEICS